MRAYRNEYHRLIANLHKTDTYIINYFQEKLMPFDLSVQQYIVLRNLLDVYPDSLTANELKERMIDKNSDMTRLVDRLVSKHMVVRETDTQNRRQVNLRLSESARPLMAQAQEQFRHFESIVSHLTDEEVATLNALLDKIRTQ